MRLLFYTLLYVFSIFAPSHAWGKDTYRHKFEESLKVGTRDLVLNGTGIRKATFFRVKVYEAGLYLTTKSHDSDAILSSADPKAIEMYVLRDVSRKDSEKVWEASFKKNCATFCVGAAVAFGKFKSSLADLKEGDLYRYFFTSGKVEVEKNGSIVARFESGDFSRVLLSTWIGAEPPTQELKKGLLGL